MLCVVHAMACMAQTFRNLTADEVRLSEELPYYYQSFRLPANYYDSIYTVSIDYPEYYDMPSADVKRLCLADKQDLPEFPEVFTSIGVDRRQAVLDAQFVPLVKRNGKYQKLVSFKLTLHSAPRNGVMYASSKKDEGKVSPSERYAAHSVLKNGTWAKIRVSETGIHELTAELIRKAGFTDLARVAVYGYGGNLQPEALNPQYLVETDDLHPVDIYEKDGRRFFYANGSVSYSTTGTYNRIRNPYSDYGYYLITQQEELVKTKDEAAYVEECHPTVSDYHTLYEKDSYAWYHGGRNLYDPYVITKAAPQTVSMKVPEGCTKGYITIAATSDNQIGLRLSVNDSIVGSVLISRPDSYSKASLFTKTFGVNNLTPETAVTVSVSDSYNGIAHLDYLLMTFEKPFDAKPLGAGCPVPEYVHNITNQDLHAHGASDMVIIIPASAKLKAEAENLKAFHEKHDSMRVVIVPADELFNEFSSGTPDANAYRRYLKMLYDRAATEEDTPKYLLLFGDGLWDNRMVSSQTKGRNPDDYLLCFESENSFSETNCYVDDGWFCLLDDGEGADPLKSDKPDIAVGRFPVLTADMAKIMVDKAIAYATNQYTGSWQNRVCMLADDGTLEESSQNTHMRQAEPIAQWIESNVPDMFVKRYYWDAYPRVVTSTGNGYPTLSRILQQEIKNGALIFDYVGHGSPTGMSHEYVLTLPDFEVSTKNRMAVWLTASCDIMPFDGIEDNIGETAVLNPYGCAIAFFGTTRTVYSTANKKMNENFIKYVLQTDENGLICNSIGEAVRLTKNALVADKQDTSANKLQYTLLGDPALKLALPSFELVVDEINGVNVASEEKVQAKAGGEMTVAGHVRQRGTESVSTDFNGILEASVYDALETIVCRNNVGHDDKPFVYEDRTSVLYNGSDSIKSGRFSFTFRVPSETSYSGKDGLVVLYARNSYGTQTGNGHSTHFTVEGSDISLNDSIGPSVYCYLNDQNFMDGGDVNATPYFYATVKDKDGINVSGSGIGHDMILSIDGLPSMTYTLNDEFRFDFGSYTSGSVGYSLPNLSPGHHTLKFRCSDVLNNTSTTQLSFNVIEGIGPQISWVQCLNNPATTVAEFLVNHNRPGCELEMTLEVFDVSGRMVYGKTITDIPETNNSTITWGLCTNTGVPLGTGIYLYRVILGSDGNRTSKSQKLIISRK